MHLNQLTAVAIARLTRAGEISAEQVVLDCLSRIAAREPVVKAWAVFDAEHALRQARELDQDRNTIKGPLHGVPVGVKDVIDTFDMRTQMGSPIYQGHQPRADAACVALVRAAGAIILGKTVTAEFAGVFPGATTNPHNPLHTPGGSSSGSAAAVADHMTPVAFGTQTGGSVLRPASFCGIVGFKPTFGRYNPVGVKPAAVSFDTVGLLARDIDDIELFDCVLVGRPLPGPDFATRREISPPRIGLCRTHLWPQAGAETVAAIDNAASALNTAGASVMEVQLPAVFAELSAARLLINDYERSRAMAHEWYRHRDMLSAPLQRTVERGLDMSHQQYIDALATAVHCRGLLDTVFDRFDVLLTPCVLGEAPPGLASAGDPRFLELWTLLHTPCVSLPTHAGPNALPVGIQIVARRGADRSLLGAARWIWEQLATRTRGTGKSGSLGQLETGAGMAPPP